MKTKLSLLAVSALILTTSWIAKAPMNEQTKVENKQVVSKSSTPEFDFFRIHRQGRYGVTSTWGFSTCQNVQRFRVESNFMYPIEEWAWGEIYSTACTGARSYKFTESPVVPGYMSYRVVAEMNDGSEIASEAYTIHILSH